MSRCVQTFDWYCRVVAKSFENDTNIHFHSLLPQFVWWQFAYTPECYEEWSDELQLIAKSLFAMQINWIPPKIFPLHFSPATKGPADFMSTRTRLEITLSCWLSSNNRLEASKGGWCLESLFFLCQPWLPARKLVPSSLLCTKRASQARIALPVRLHQNQPFIGSSRTWRRAVQLLWRSL